MVSLRDWVPTSWGGSANELMEMDADELDLEARTFETQIELKEKELERMDHEFQQLVEKGQNASGPKKERLKRKAKQLKRNYEDKEGAWQELLEEYTTLLAVKNAKERMEEQPQSALRDLDEADVEEFMQGTIEEIHARNQETEWISRQGDQVNHALSSVAKDFGATMEESEIDQLFEDATKQPKSLSDLTKEEKEDEDEIFDTEL